MADTVSTQILQNGFQNIIVKFTNFSDGTGETGVTKVDATSTGPYGVSKGGILYYPGIHLSVYKMNYDVRGMLLRMQWDADTDQDMFLLSGYDEQDFTRFGGLTVPVISGATGNILFTTLESSVNSTYSIVMHLKKNVPVT